jgi:hypothetical protein
MFHPYQNPAVDEIYELLFGDDLSPYRSSQKQNPVYPWTMLLAEPPDRDALFAIIQSGETESRVKLLANLIFRQQGWPVPVRELLGVIVELGLEGGLDVLASYRDGTARYINYTGHMIIWESPDDASNQLTNTLFREAEKIVSQIGPWHKPRRPFPAKDMLRISFLMSDGLYFGEGPINTMFNDPFAAPALSAATGLMQFLTSK